MPRTPEAEARSRAAWITLILTEVALLGPIAIDLASDGRRVFAYLAADAFYYLTVSRNVVRRGIVTFDGEHATNGFHPLWQMLEVPIYGLSSGAGASDYAVLYVVVAVCAAMLGVAVALLAFAMRDHRGRLTPWLVLLPLGAHAAILAPLWLEAGPYLPAFNPFEGSAPLWGTLWHYANGMETAALLLAWAALAWVFVRRPALRERRWAIAMGLAMAAVSLARLDHVFFAAALGLSLWVGALRARDFAGAGRLALGGAVGAVPVLLYLGWNQLAFGAATPVSGRLKSTFPAPTGENFSMLARWIQDFPLDTDLEGPARLCGMLVPAIFCAIELLRGRPVSYRRLATQPWARWDYFLRASAMGCLALTAYDWLFVKLFDQGHWYWPISTLLVSLLVLRWIGRLAFRRGPRVGPRVRVALSALCLPIALGAFVRFHRHEDTHAHFAYFMLEAAPRLRAYYGAHPPRMVEFDDGVVGYATGFDTMPATGLTLDPEGAARAHAGETAALAAERGFDRFTSSIIERGRVRGGIQPIADRYRVELEVELEHDRGVFRILPR